MLVLSGHVFLRTKLICSWQVCRYKKCEKAHRCGLSNVAACVLLGLNCSYLILIVLPFSVFCSCDCHSCLLLNGEVHAVHFSSVLKLLISVYVCSSQKIAVECCQDKLLHLVDLYGSVQKFLTQLLS